MFSLVIAENLQLVQNVVSVKCSKMRYAVLTLEGPTLRQARCPISPSAKWAGGDWLSRVHSNSTILCTLVGFLYEMSILQRGTPCILRFSMRICLYNSTFRKLWFFIPHWTLFSNKEVLRSLIIWCYQRRVYFTNSLLCIADTTAFAILSFKTKVTFAKQPRWYVRKIGIVSGTELNHVSAT